MKKTLLSAAFVGISAMALAQAPQKLVIEEFTGAWCGYCGDGALIMQDIMDGNPNVFGISVHNADAMTTIAGNSVESFYNTLGFPSATLNRAEESQSRSSWATQASAATSGTSICSMAFDSWTYDPVTRDLSVTISASFTGSESGSFKINLAITEDNVTGTGSGYNQVNYYNTTSGHPHYGLGNPIVGYSHMHVARAYL